MCTLTLKAHPVIRWDSSSKLRIMRRGTSLILRHLMSILLSYRKLLISTFVRQETTVLFSSSFIFFLYFIMITTVPVGAAIDCFRCSSLNKDNLACEDPFHNNFSVSYLESPCMGGRKGRDGLFPATACIKLAGEFVETGETITVRGCALDSGTLNTDTEIIRMSHCGHFYFEDRYVKGCLKSCDDADGCNPSTRPIMDRTFYPLPFHMLIIIRCVHLYLL